MNHKSKFKFLSFFSGVGGLDYGLEYAGWDCLLALDNDKSCAQTLKTYEEAYIVTKINTYHI
tara:strand:- start:219 stop:404 length:186 start_codon:yes stop_codon:yes gene_type:complete